ncbi:unnamed protein product [Periconia digitata]|uniref:geranylgeranyl diphosphate synthase n=1 Tax=Periconia digitata TaxID=1303443 RepID=A0A9W4UTN8_9PLEO|nr:unnamed protein product [Periconia digitata]
MPSGSPTSQPPFPSPNAIPPRTSSHGLINGVKARSSVLRPLSEVDWLSQSKQSKLQPHQQTSVPPAAAMDPSQQPTDTTPQEPPPPTTTETLGADLVYGHTTRWTDDKERILLGPYDYLLGHPGKDIRSQCIAAFNKWLKVPQDRLQVITRVVGMLHTASLLVDDVEDNSVLRRGIPVANSIYGVAQTINTANYVYFKALQELIIMGNPLLVQIYSEELLNLHRGQGMELHWRDSLTCPTEADYLEMVDNKTGGLFRLAIKLMQAESSVAIDCAPLVSTIGLLFQILDDHLNLSPSSGYSDLKGLCEDLTEGKFSFPVIHAIHTDPANRILYNILKQKTTDEEVKRYALKYMQKKGSFEYSMSVIDDLRGKALALVAEAEKLLAGQDDKSGMEGAEGLRSLLAKLVVR